jgi:hypothetical protein
MKTKKTESTDPALPIARNEHKTEIEQVLHVYEQIDRFDLQRQERAAASIKAAIMCGSLLVELKEDLKKDPHARWQKWCEEHIPAIEPRKRERMMKLAHFMVKNPSILTEILKCLSLHEAYKFMDRSLKKKTPPDLGPEPGENKKEKEEPSGNLKDAMDKADALYSALLKIKSPEDTEAMRERCEPILDWFDIAALRSEKAASPEPLKEAA